MSYFPRQSSEDKKRLIFNIGLLFIGLGILSVLLMGGFSFLVDGELFENYGRLTLFVSLGISATLAEHILIVLDKPQRLFIYGIGSYAIYLGLLTAVAFGSKSSISNL